MDEDIRDDSYDNQFGGTFQKKETTSGQSTPYSSDKFEVLDADKEDSTVKAEFDALTAAIMPSSRLHSYTDKVSQDKVIKEDKERRRVVVIEECDGVPS